ncbi:MAG TPA: gamma-glutamyl-gamma-aminobutyrate hydrolase family protein, partial [Methylomirabilota bacterium]|nr:gamma-glutamyl-gamma-aminobutyrate hydrolase family protein [Methylomirabilota bacterium]
RSAGVLPVMLPAMAPDYPTDDLLERVDGLFLTGSLSNVEPHHYGGPVIDPSLPHDPARDATTLRLIPAAIERRIPALAICRGFQEVNVALGGSLLQKVHETAGYHDHREDTTADLDIQYGPAHLVRLSAGGVLRDIAGADEVRVNSLHGQGIARLGDGLIAEAVAPDGLVEAVRLERSETFLLAVQWHPEWRSTENPFYDGIFKAFAAACRARANAR